MCCAPNSFQKEGIVDMENERLAEPIRGIFIFYWLGVFLMWLTGWRVEGKVPDEKKCVFVVAPHTSNWDVIIAILVTFVLRMRSYWMAKHTIFVPPLSWLLRAYGAVPINRSKSHSVVDQVVAEFNARDTMLIAVATEGTRKYTEYWKSGFYHIALKAKVPIAFGFVDYKRKVAGIGGIMYPTGNVKEDMDKIRAFYEQITPRHPERMGPIRIKDENKSS
jgi:1-acyl-sn-glycerol-3-phosphate acyltransferase